MSLSDPARPWGVSEWASLAPRDGNLTDTLLNGKGSTEYSSSMTFGQLLASLAAGGAAFLAQFILFNLLRTRLKRVYFPKSYMVPEKERVAEPGGGIFGWLVSVMKTSNSDFITKCGLDAYFYLRYLRMLLKIFVPIAVIFIPVLVPVNHVGITDSRVAGIDQFAWQNITESHTNRLWVHVVAAICLVVYFCYTVYQELRGYIRIRQAYLTSPQHRIRASATTVLVTNIPRNWLSKEELEGLYDVFPGGIRNIWINRNYDELDSLVATRDKLATSLEDLYANLLQKSQVKYIALRKKDPTQAPSTDGERPGLSIGNPHQIAHNLDEALGRRGSIISSSSSSSSDDSDAPDSASKPVFPFIPGVATGIEAVGHGIGAVGHGVGKLGRVVKDIGRGRKETRTNADQRAGPPEAVPQLDGADQPQLSPTYSHGEGLAGSIRSKKTDREGDEIPLRDLGKDSSSITRKRDKAENTRKKGPFASFAALFQNSLEEDMPKVPSVIKLTLAATARRRQLLKDEAPSWLRWLPESERETMRLHPSPWINWMPFTGTTLDSIDYHTVVLAIYNEYIERLQKDPERFPLMNSAFIQFNHQVAAHMACQSLNHHMPFQMAPRVIEISPNDVAWGNLSIPWWMRYARTALVLVIVAALIILWAPLVTLTSLIGQLSYLAELAPFLDFVNDWPRWLVSAIQGVLPPLLLSIFLIVLPMIIRALCMVAGATTGHQAELSVQNYFFAFLFIQLFLVVTISGAIVPVIKELSKNVASAPAILARNLPKVSNYFISYIILQAFSVSASALLQVGALIINYLWAKLVDNSPRSVFTRVTSLPEIKWGSFFPIYTNLAVIGLVYSVVTPLILLFNLCTFSLFWVAHRYNALYVNRYHNDTGGLLFPRAINQLFIGLYTMELCLCGLFLLQRDEQNDIASSPQAVIMFITFLLTILYQVLLNRGFSPLFRYIPITMEDEAVRRDEEFAAMQAQRFENNDQPNGADDGEDGRVNDFRIVEEEREGDNLQDLLKAKEERENQESELREAREREKIDAKRQGRSRSHGRTLTVQNEREVRAGSGSRPAASRRESSNSMRNSWAKQTQPRHSIMYNNPEGSKVNIPRPPNKRRSSRRRPTRVMQSVLTGNPVATDVEKQQSVDNSFFYGINDDLEDLTQEERDILVDKAFKHRAARATRPAVWIPKDLAGVSEFEIRLIDKDPVFRKYIWISDEGAWLNEKGKIDRNRMNRPPDFNEEKLVVL